MNKPRTLEGQTYKPILKSSYLYKGPFSKAVETARHYGFHLIEPISLSSKLPSSLTKIKKDSMKIRDMSGFPKDYMSTLKKYIDEEMYKFAQPIMFCHIAQKGKNSVELRLEIVGTKKSVAEATLIKTASIILNELGYKNVAVRLNSIGDKESGNNFVKELTNYYRDHIDNFPPIIQQQLKRDILKFYTNRTDKYKEINDNAPKPIGFLSEESRIHFAQIIDFLENLEMSYEICDDLVGLTTCPPKTIYEIYEVDSKNKEALAHGERHNYLAQSIGFNKKIPIVGIGIGINKKSEGRDVYTKITKTPTFNPKIYFIHLGFDAKKRSLSVLEIFRKSRVGVHQSLHEDSFADQLRMAESMSVPYTMIMGQKEVLDNSIIFRNMETRYQESIEIPKLEEFLLNLRNRKLV